MSGKYVIYIYRNLRLLPLKMSLHQQLGKKFACLLHGWIITIPNDNSTSTRSFKQMFGQNSSLDPRSWIESKYSFFQRFNPIGYPWIRQKNPGFLIIATNRIQRHGGGLPIPLSKRKMDSCNTNRRTTSWVCSGKNPSSK